MSVSELEKSIFLDLVLLHFTPQLLPTLSVDLRDGQLLILCQLHCHVPVSEFLLSGKQSGEKSNVGRQCLNHALNLSSLSLFSFSKLNKVLDTNKYN